MPRPLVAKHRRPDGSLAARVEVPQFVNRRDAARALAMVYPEQVPVSGERGVRDGLSRAARERVLTRRGAEPDPALAEAYLPIIDRHWTRFFKYDDGKRWVGSGDSTAALARFDVGTLFSRSEAALALALEYGTVPVRVGRMTLERGMHQAADKRLLARKDAAKRADAEVVDRFYALLGEIGPWSQHPG